MRALVGYAQIVADILNSNSLRVVAYLIVAAACAVVGRAERRVIQNSGLDLWPTFWFLTAGMLTVMALARATDLAELLTALGRSEARSSGWYEARRPIQAAVVISVSVGWFLSVAVAIWRVPERRRRYLPAAIVVFSLICFAAIRMVSFHYVDAFLYNHPIVGVRIGSIVELGGVALALVAALRRLGAPRAGRHRGVHGGEELPFQRPAP